MQAQLLQAEPDHAIHKRLQLLRHLGRAEVETPVRHHLLRGLEGAELEEVVIAVVRGERNQEQEGARFFKAAQCPRSGSLGRRRRQTGDSAARP